jgi:hypothetical protein
MASSQACQVRQDHGVDALLLPSGVELTDPDLCVLEISDQQLLWSRRSVESRVVPVKPQQFATREFSLRPVLEPADESRTVSVYVGPTLSTDTGPPTSDQDISGVDQDRVAPHPGRR